MKKLSQLFRRSADKTASKRKSASKSSLAKRRLRNETLEKRELLAGDLGMAAPDPVFAEHHNYWNPYDVNDDRVISPLDALTVINQLRANSLGVSGENAADMAMVDVNADGNITPLDALQVINALRRGEQVNEVIGLQVTARDDADNQLAQDADGRYSVSTFEPFFLEVAYTDERFDELGAFSIFANLLAGEVQPNGQFVAGNAGNLEPVLNETQIFRGPVNGLFDQSGATNYDSFTYTIEGSDATFTQPFTSGSSLVTGLRAALTTEFGYTADQFEIDGPTSSQGDSVFTLRFTDLSLSDQDLPDITIMANPSASADPTNFPPRTLTTRDIAPRLADGTPNPAAFQFNVNIMSRTNNREFYNLLPNFDYDPALGILNAGGNSGSADESVPGFSEPFDAYSIRVQFRNVDPNIDVAVRPPTGDNAQILLYGRQDAVPADLVLLGPQSIAEFIVTGDLVDVAINDTAITIGEDSGAATVDLNTLVTAGAPNVFTVGTVTGGTATISGTTLTFTPAANFNGPATVGISATDGTSTDTATVTFNVTPVNDPPVANDDGPFATAAETDLTIQATTLLANDTTGADNETDTLTITSVGPATALGGTVSIAGGVITYSPPAGQANVSDSFTYTVSDGTDTDTATVTISIGAVATPPMAGDASRTTNEDTAVTVDLTTLNTGGMENVAFTIVSNDNPTVAAASITGNILTLTPAANQNGTVVVTYNAANGVGNDNGVITFTVTPVNDAPTAVNDSFNATEDTDLIIQVADLLANDSPGPNETDTLTVTAFDATTVGGGTVVRNNGTLTYSPAANFNGADSFTYTISDGALTATATVNIQVAAVAEAPVINDFAAQLEQGNAFTLDLTTLDVGTDPATTFTVGNVTGGGTASITGTTLTVNGNAGFLGDIVVTVNGANSGGNDNGVVTVTVVEQNVPPTVVPIVRTADERDASFTFDLLAAATDAGPVTISGTPTKANDPSNGVSINGSIVTVNPAAYAALLSGQSQVITVNYAVTDGTNAPVSNTATITINGFSPLMANLPDVTVNAGNAVEINLLAPSVIGGRDPASVTVSGVTLSDPAAGTFTVNNGVIRFQPTAGFDGTVSLAFTLDDGTDQVAGTVNVIVNAFDPATLSGVIFQDSISNLEAFLNGAPAEFNGVQDANEAGFAGVPVQLINRDTGAVVQTVFSGLDGTYQFDQIPPGNYRVLVDLPDSIEFAGERFVDFTATGDSDPAFAGPTISPVRFNNNLGYLDALARTYIGRDPAMAAATNGGLEGGIVVIGADGNQEVFQAGQGFLGIQFAELVMNDALDAALLTIVTSDGMVRTAELSDNQFVSTPDGSAARFFGGVDDFTFTNVDMTADNSAIQSDFAGYLQAIDQILGSMA